MTTIRAAAQLAAGKQPTENLAFDPNDLPITGTLWHITVAPVKPRTKSDGGIDLPDEATRAEQHLISVGKILAMGAFAYTAKTPSGIDLSLDPNKPKVGDYVLFDQGAGTRVVFRDGRTLLLLTDTELKAIVKPSEVSNLRFYL